MTANNGGLSLCWYVCVEEGPSKADVAGSRTHPIDTIQDDDDDGVTAERATRTRRSGPKLGATNKKREKSTDRRPYEKKEPDDGGE